ncbi:hypothetical protein SAMN05446037_10583 [Anaerovirgula multivorans]|uniref:Uncharacterized protein n=1 Tax=Anaerovirgula multivorans TaxID=312168 RepID=A0A239KZF5_9FIRM|nr:hypothetical protein [Anaerovirgula multivorans]SNT23112.1 hypothetical protein SAMN05446037_10583 [Anaerovirgula multivorans]
MQSKSTIIDLEVKQVVGGDVYIYTKDQYGGLVYMGERISAADFVSMFNWYRYQKENGNEDLIF